MASSAGVVSVLNQMEAILADQYLPFAQEHFHFFGSNTNRLVTPVDSRKITSNIFKVKVKTTHARSGQMTRNLKGAFPLPKSPGRAEYELELSITEANNDFARFKTGMQIDYYTLKAAVGNAAQIADSVADIFNDTMADAAESLALHRHLPQSAAIATVAEKKNNDARTMAAASTYTGGSSTARIRVANGPIAAFQPGRVLYCDDGTDTANITITDYNAVDHSFGVSVSGNLDAVTTAGVLYIQGEYNASVGQGLNGFRSWADDTTLYGVNRSTPANDWMNMTKLVKNGEDISQAIFDELADAMPAVREDYDSPKVALMWHKAATKLRNDVGENAMVAITPNNADQIAKMGFSGLVYIHPVFGKVVIAADPFAIPGRVNFIKKGSWEMVYPYGSTPMLEFIDDWYRLELDYTGGQEGRGLDYRRDGHLIVNDICHEPRENAVITGLNTLL